MPKTRRLAAVMFTDMVEYTAAAQADEKATLALRSEQEAIVRPLLTKHQGRKVKSTGDGLLVEFDSSLKATECAINIQQRLHERNERTGATPINLRIGIHLGDVEQQGADIFGDAVNIASRIQPVAEPGGICVSNAVHEQVWNKISDRLEKLPPTALKGLRVPMDLYRVVLPWTGQASRSATLGPTGIAVLPFTNISPDPKDEYFADGLTEELITVLSQLRELPVIARTSVMQYKSTTKAVSQIGTELGVATLLEGSVRKAGNRLRITAQLIDAATQRHLWANSYDRELDDVFAVQTEIARRVMEALKIELRPAEVERLEARSAVSPDSYLAYLKGRTLLHGTSKTELEGARGQFELAISLDPKNAAAHAGLANTVRRLGIWYADVSLAEWAGQSRRLVDRAIELDPSLAEAHHSLAELLFVNYEWAASEREFKLALSLDPSYALAHNVYAQLLENVVRGDEAILEFTLAEAADPLWPLNLAQFAYLLVALEKFDEAFTKIQKLGRLEPSGYQYHSVLASYRLAQSDVEGALKELQRVEKLVPESRWKPIIRALSYALSGEKEKSRALLKREETLPEIGQVSAWIAEAYAELGDLDECFRWLDKACVNHNVLIFPFRISSRFKHLRSDPRFEVFLKKVNLA